MTAFPSLLVEKFGYAPNDLAQPNPLGSLMRVDFDQAALPEPILSEIALCLFAAFRKSFRM